MTLKFIRVLEVVEIRVQAKLNQAACGGSWVIVLKEKKSFDENNTVRRYRAYSNYIFVLTADASYWSASNGNMIKAS